MNRPVCLIWAEGLPMLPPHAARAAARPALRAVAAQRQQASYAEAEAQPGELVEPVR